MKIIDLLPECKPDIVVVLLVSLLMDDKQEVRVILGWQRLSG